MVRQFVARRRAALAVAAGAAIASGCGTVPRAHLDDCQRVSQTLRSDNARLKDQVVALQGQNRDLAERAVDDARQLALQEETIANLEGSVQAYQAERAQLESAYTRLTSNLGGLDTRPEAWPNQARQSTRRRAPGSEATANPHPPSAAEPEDHGGAP